MKALKLKFHSDNGHGWLAVKKDTLNKLGIANIISSYSYEKNKTAYLEEDCDAEKLFAKLHENNIQYTVDNLKSVERSPIRNYSSYRHLTIVPVL